MTKTAVYIMRDKAGKVLYIGCSGNVVIRVWQHKPKGWLVDISDIRLKWYENRTRAETAEARFIRRFRPIHNKVHNPDFGAARIPAQRRSIRPTSVPPAPIYCINGRGGRCFAIGKFDKKFPAASEGFTFPPDVPERVIKVARSGDTIYGLPDFDPPAWFAQRAFQVGVEFVPANTNSMEGQGDG